MEWRHIHTHSNMEKDKYHICRTNRRQVGYGWDTQSQSYTKMFNQCSNIDGVIFSNFLIMDQSNHCNRSCVVVHHMYLCKWFSSGQLSRPETSQKARDIKSGKGEFSLTFEDFSVYLPFSKLQMKTLCLKMGEIWVYSPSVQFHNTDLWYVKSMALVKSSNIRHQYETKYNHLELYDL